MERLTIVRKLKNAADRWEKENPIIGVGELRVCDALRDAAYTIEALDIELAAYRDIGTLKELTALAKAHNDGRVVALPCKVGDTVYIIIHGIVEETKVRTFFIGHPSYNRGEPGPRYEMIRVENYDIPLKNFGKTVFLTRAEAEAALKGVSNGKN
ncbi:MAG: hypothetical protein RR743_01020 [Oscillospiraceae bacterium]